MNNELFINNMEFLMGMSADCWQPIDEGFDGLTIKEKTKYKNSDGKKMNI